MLKSLLFSMLSVLLVLTILAPSIEALYDNGTDTFVMIDLNEEENHSNESEKKYDQKELFFSNYNHKVNLQLHKEITKGQVSIIPYSDFSTEIILPPPEGIS